MAFLTDKVSPALVRVHVLLQVVGLEEMFVALRALDPPLMCVREHVLFQVLFPDECSVTEVTLELLCTGVDEHMRRHVGFLGKQLLANRASVVLLTCVDLEVHPEVAGIAEGLTAVFTLVRFHPHVAHEVHVELCGCEKSPGTHAALEFLLPYVTLTFCSGGNIVIRVSVTVAPVAAAVGVITVCLSCSVGVAGPRGRGGARGPIG